jgi:hypothetical protein
VDFSQLTNDNIILFAVKNYNNPCCHSLKEFNEDLEKLKYIKRLMKRYNTKGILKDRLILNHLITLYNVFPIEPCTRILFFRLESPLWPILKTFLVFLDLMPLQVIGVRGDIIQTANIPLDNKLIIRLRAITANK